MTMRGSRHSRPSLPPSEKFLQLASVGKLAQMQSMVRDGLVDPGAASAAFNNQTALHAAILKGKPTVVRWLVEEQGVDPEAVDLEDQTPFHYCAFHGDVEMLEYLQSKGVDCQAQDRIGRKATTHAALNGQVEALGHLIERCGISINAVDYYGGTALHWAAAHGRLHVVRNLVERGIDVNLTVANGRTAAVLAESQNRGHCAKWLKEWVDRLKSFLQAAIAGDLAAVQVSCECGGYMAEGTGGARGTHVHARVARRIAMLAHQASGHQSLCFLARPPFSRWLAGWMDG